MSGAAARREFPGWGLARHFCRSPLVDFCYGWTLWLFLSWIPAFFFENYHLNLQSSAMFTSGVLLAGVIGDTVGGVVSDRILRSHRQPASSARRSVIVVGFLGAVRVPGAGGADSRSHGRRGCLSLAFFFAELIVGPIWSVPMDIAPRLRRYRQRDDELRLCAGRLRLTLQLRFPGRSDGKLGRPLHRLDRLLLLGALLASRLRPDRPFELPASAAPTVPARV